MPARKYAQRLQLECLPVTLLRAVFIFAVVTALLCVSSLPVALSLKLSLLLLVGVFARRCWCRRCELGAGNLTLIWDADNRWWWRQGGKETELVLRGDSYLATAMVVLNFRQVEGGRRRALVLLPASVGAEAFRRLRVRLRLEGRESTETTQGKLALRRRRS